MRAQRLYRYHYIVADCIRWIGDALRLSEITLGPVVELFRRITLAQIFFVAGMMQLSQWQMGMIAIQPDVALPGLSPATSMAIAMGTQLIAPALLVAGLLTRFAALALVALVWQAHIMHPTLNAEVFWLIILGWWVVAGAGRISVDNLLQGIKDSALPLMPTLGRIFDFLTHHLQPLYSLGIRCWLAVILFIAGHPLVLAQPLFPIVEFFSYQPQTAALRMLDGGWALTLFINGVTGIGAMLLLLGLGTRLIALFIFIIMAIASFALPTAAPLASEFVYWLTLLSILFFNGPGRYSLDAIVRRKISAWFPQLQGELPKNIVHLPHVVIIGGGFGGIAAAKSLRSVACTVTLIDRHNYHLFQPLLYQVATASLSPADIAVPIRGLFQEQKNIRVRLGEVVGIDKDKKTVALKSGEALPFDYLVVATGAQHGYFGKDEWAAFAPGLKRIEDALAMRAKILRAFELAENSDNPAEQAAHLSFVIVGGGPTGVELAGALAELAQHGLEHEFRNINPKQAKIYLIESGPKPLGVFPETLSAYTRQFLEKLNVIVMTGQPVTAMDADGVTVDGQKIIAKNIFWAAGVQASKAAQWLGAESDRAGRAKVLPNLTLPGYPHIYAVGDTVLAEVWNGKPMPGLAPAAKQSGAFAARQIRNRIEGRPTAQAFRYVHYGSLATIGRKSAVADFGSWRLAGSVAWWFWGLVHVLFLTNTRSRIAVATQWLWSYITFKPSTRLITDSNSPGTK